MKRIGIWIRVSTLDQKRGDSPEIHEARARSYAESKGWEVVTVYHLEGISGKSVVHQKEAQRMVEDVKNNRIDGLIFSKLARLARNTRELLDFADMFEENNASMVSLQESIDTSTPAGRLFYTILGAMAQWEREETAERIQASMATRRKLGKLTGGIASYGFKIEDSELVIDEKEAPVRKLMFELFLEHKRRTTVAKILNERGYTTRKGKKFSDMSITRLLKNPDAKGIRKSNYYIGNTKDIRPKEEWHYAPCPKIVDEELWDAVNAIIAEQEQGNANSKPLNQRVHLFTSFLECHNGHKMSVVTKTNKYSCSKCSLRIDKDDLEEVFHSRIQNFILSEDEVAEHLKNSDKAVEDKKDEIQSTKKNIEENEKKMNRLIELNVEGQIPTKGFNLHYNPLFEQSEKLKVTLTQLEKELQKIIQVKNSFGSVLKESKGIYDKWDSFNRPEKRAIVEAITNTIIFDGKTINFKLKQISPSLSFKLGQNAQHNPTPLSLGAKLPNSWANSSPREKK